MEKVGITKAAIMQGSSRQAIYLAIKQGRLKATKGKREWEIKLEDLKRFNEEKYDKSKSIYNGEKLYQPEIGLLSPEHVMEMTGLKKQAIYYLARTHRLSTIRRGMALIFFKDNVEAYIRNNMPKVDVRAS